MSEANKSTSLVGELGYFTEDEFLQLTGYAPQTALNMRKRRQGPAFIRLGKAYYYPKAGVQKYMASRVKEPRELAVAGVL